MKPRGSVPFALVLVLATAGAWGASRVLSPAPSPVNDRPSPPVEMPWPRPVAGGLTPAARSAVAEFASAAPFVLVVLRGRDWLTCEDLGRQLRELEHRNPSLTYVIATDSADVVQSFARRERLRWRVLGLRPGDVVDGYPALPTPAVLVVREGGARLAGVSHPERVPNARFRSFADELADVFP